MAIVGRYVLPAAVWPHLATTTPGAGGEIQLTDALRELAGSAQGMYGVVVAGTRHDAGDKLGYLRANLAYALKRPDLRDAVLALCHEMLAASEPVTPARHDVVARAGRRRRRFASHAAQPCPPGIARRRLCKLGHKLGLAAARRPIATAK